LLAKHRSARGKWAVTQAVTPWRIFGGVLHSFCFPNMLGVIISHYIVGYYGNRYQPFMEWSRMCFTLLRWVEDVSPGVRYHWAKCVDGGQLKGGGWRKKWRNSLAT
jgi:hypothetical protein